MASAIVKRNPTVVAFGADNLSPEADRSAEITDEEFWHDMVFGMLVGTPLTWLVSIAIALAAGLGLGPPPGPPGSLGVEAGLLFLWMRTACGQSSAV